MKLPGNAAVSVIMLLMSGAVSKTSSKTIANVILEIAHGHMLARHAAEFHPAPELNEKMTSGRPVSLSRPRAPRGCRSR